MNASRPTALRTTSKGRAYLSHLQMSSFLFKTKLIAKVRVSQLAMLTRNLLQWLTPYQQYIFDLRVPVTILFKAIYSSNSASSMATTALPFQVMDCPLWTPKAWNYIYIMIINDWKIELLQKLTHLLLAIEVWSLLLWNGKEPYLS